MASEVVQDRDRPISNNTMLYALYRLGYKGKMTGHGFRTDVIERQLANSEQDGARGAYNRAGYLPERKKMMQAWADHLDKLRAGADAIPLHGNKA